MDASKKFKADIQTEEGQNVSDPVEIHPQDNANERIVFKVFNPGSNIIQSGEFLRVISFV